MPMILALLVTSLGFATLIYVQGATSPPVIYGVYYAGTLSLVYLVVRVWLPHADAMLLPLVTLLTGLGLVMIFRLSQDIEAIENLATTQSVWILVGSGALLFIALFFRNYEVLFGYKYLFALAAVVLVGLTLTPLGTTVNGARLSVEIGSVNFQPSVFARIALVIFFAGYLADKRELLAATSRSFLGMQIPRLKYFGPVLLVWAGSLALMVLQNDLGSGLLFFAVPILMMYAATGRIAYVILGGGLFAVGSYAAYEVFGRVQERVQVWLDPRAYSDDQGYQILQSLYNISDGGVLGTGLGGGFSHTIPEVQTDFIFSTIASELGLIGAAGVLMVFLIFIYRGIKVSLLAGDSASKLLAYGLSTMFAIQTFIIIGGVLKAIPLTGITLPFVSYGGSSVVGNFILTGLLLVVSERAGKQAGGRR